MITDDKNLALGCSDFEVVEFRAIGINAAVVPAGDDLLDFMAGSLEDKRYGTLIGLEAADLRAKLFKESIMLMY